MMQGLPDSRKSLFEEVERKELRPLPDTKFELASWKKVKANIDYHIVLEKCQRLKFFMKVRGLLPIRDFLRPVVSRQSMSICLWGTESMLSGHLPELLIGPER